MRVCVRRERQTHRWAGRREKTAHGLLSAANTACSQKKRTLWLILFWVSIYHIWFTWLPAPIQPWIHLKIQRRSLSLFLEKSWRKSKVWNKPVCFQESPVTVPCHRAVRNIYTDEHLWGLVISQRKKNLCKSLILCVDDTLGHFFYLNTNIWFLQKTNHVTHLSDGLKNIP